MLAALRLAACLVTLLIAGPGHAQSYPSGNVRIVVPYPPGGPTDVMARLLAQKLSEASAASPHRGDVYEKDLGPNTARIAVGITAFNPDNTWQRVTDATQPGTVAK